MFFEIIFFKKKEKKNFLLQSVRGDLVVASLLTTFFIFALLASRFLGKVHSYWEIPTPTRSPLTLWRKKPSFCFEKNYLKKYLPIFGPFEAEISTPNGKIPLTF